MKVYKYDVEYASQVLDKIPYGYIDKTICGCGLTTVALENSEDVIIAVPTIYLAINKSEQYPNERSKNKVLAVFGETTEKDIKGYIQKCKQQKLPIKIMITYDSVYRIKDLLKDCRLIIDESNELLKVIKQPNRREGVNKLLELAKEYKDTVSFISATPIQLSYMPDWIKDIPQVKITWEGTRKSTPILMERTYPFKALREEIIIPLQKNDHQSLAGKTFKKLIIFINSLSQITQIIRESKLSKDDCGIICGDSLKNDLRINGIKRYTTGKMPKYLFITSSGFSGIDLYDDDAMTVVVSNTKKNYTMVDMLTDLKQAISRNRSKSNPNYGTYVYIYNQTVFNQSEEELIQKIEKYRETLQYALDNYINKSIKDNVDMLNSIKEDVNNYCKLNNGLYEVDDNLFNADKYFILETRNQYTKGFEIKDVQGIKVQPPTEIKVEVITYTDTVDYFDKNHVNGVVDWTKFNTKEEWIRLIEDTYKEFKKTWKDQTYAKNMISSKDDPVKIRVNQIKSLFKRSKRYTRTEIKDILQKTYNKLKINRKAKWTDLEEVVKIKHVTVRGTKYIEVL